jgi:hypothetical protein
VGSREQGCGTTNKEPLRGVASEEQPCEETATSRSEASGEPREGAENEVRRSDLQ